MPTVTEVPARVVWASGSVAIEVCPKSFVTAQSMAWIETYLVRRKLGQKGIDGLTAREVEAFLILEHEIEEQTEANRMQGEALAYQSRGNSAR